MSNWISAQEKIRIQFEDFASSHYMLCEISVSRNPHQLDEYMESEMQVAWETWQSAHAKWFSEPVGWFTDDHLTDKSATTYSPAIAKSWEEKDWPATGLYLNPAEGE